MTTEGPYDKGDLIRCSAAFTNSAGVAADPTTVTFKVKDAQGVITTYDYVTDAEVVKDSTGNYHVDILADASGDWHYRFEGTGAVVAAEEGAFVVEASQF